MSEPIVNIAEHPLSAFLASHRQSTNKEAKVIVGIEPGRAHVNVRAKPQNQALTSALSNVLGQSLPEPGRVSRDARTIYWLGPEEFLIVGSVEDSRALTDTLRNELTEHHASTTDLSGGQLLLTLSGPSARALLSKASTLDLDEQVFSLGQCAQSTFAKASALYALRDTSPVFELIVRRSFADYVAQWLVYAGQEFGLAFDVPDTGPSKGA